MHSGTRWTTTAHLNPAQIPRRVVLTGTWYGTKIATALTSPVARNREGPNYSVGRRKTGERPCCPTCSSRTRPAALSPASDGQSTRTTVSASNKRSTSRRAHTSSNARRCRARACSRGAIRETLLQAVPSIHPSRRGPCMHERIYYRRSTRYFAVRPNPKKRGGGRDGRGGRGG